MNNREGLVGNKGFIKITILIVVGLVVLKYAYDVDVVGYLGQFWEKYDGEVIWNKIVNFIKGLID